MSNMKTREFHLYRYAIAFDPSGKMVTAEKTREGLIVELKENGRVGLGEVAPLLGFSRETFQTAVMEAHSLLRVWQEGGAIEALLENAAPSVAFGVSLALMECSGELTEVIETRAAQLLSCEEIPAFMESHHEAITHSTVKVKVGRGNAQDEARKIVALIDQYPTVTIRADANRAWHLAQAMLFAETITPKRLKSFEFIEEPCLLPRESLAFAKNTACPIAWDERLRDADFNPNHLDEGVAAWVIKPTLVGSTRQCHHLIKIARSRNIQPILSSSYESSLGLTQLMRLSAQWIPGTIPGLDTGSAFQTHIVRPLKEDTRPILPLSALEKIA